MLWITSVTPQAKLRRQALLGLLALVLGMSLTACGSKRSMEGGKTDDEVGQVHSEDGVTRLEGEEEGIAKASFDEAEAARRAKAAHLPSGNTRSGPGKLKEVTVRPGDTLWKIAERKDVYGSGWLYPLIYKANQAAIKDPNRLDAGLKLKVPRDVPDAEVEMAKEEAMTGQILDASPAPGAKPTPAPAPPKPVKSGSASKFWALLALLALAFFLWKLYKRFRQPGPEPADGADGR